MTTSSDSEKEKFDLFPMACGFAIGAMPALLWLPIIGRLMRWLLEHRLFAFFFIFMNYLPWMLGSLFGRMLGLPVLIPILFCIAYWIFIGALAGMPRYYRAACFYVV